MLVVPALVAGCFGSRRAGTPAPGAKTPDAIAARPRPDSQRPVVDLARAARDSVTADSLRRADAVAVDSTARRDTGTKSGVSRKVPAKPAKRCIFDTQDSPPETRVRFQRLPDSTSLMFLGGGVVGH